MNQGVADSEGVTHWANYSIVLNDAISIAQGEILIDFVKGLAPLRSKLVAVDVSRANQLWDGSITFDGSHAFGEIVNSGVL